MKKITFFFVLCSLFILSSCQNPINPSKPHEPSIPAGKGSFTLVISDINGRTIIPSTTLNSFAEYTLKFYPNGSSTPIKETRTNATLDTDPIILDAGKYTLHVTAYMSAGEGEPAADGWLNIDIIEGQNNKGEVSLKAFIDTGTGTFSWNISFPTGVTEASLTITSQASGSVGQKINITNGTPASVVLDSGYYNVLLTLIKDNDTHSQLNAGTYCIYIKTWKVFLRLLSLIAICMRKTMSLHLFTITGWTTEFKPFTTTGK